jgi:hypothetical protein
MPYAALPTSPAMTIAGGIISPAGGNGLETDGPPPAGTGVAAAVGEWSRVLE